MKFWIEAFDSEDLPQMTAIWNAVVEAGNAFPQEDELSLEEASEFFLSQTRTAVAKTPDGEILGLYILHPNNVGRASHIANASYAVSANRRGSGIGRALVEDSLASLGTLGFDGLQFNAVVASNAQAMRLYESLGFKRIGCIPRGFRNSEDILEDILIFYHPA